MGLLDQRMPPQPQQPEQPQQVQEVQQPQMMPPMMGGYEPDQDFFRYRIDSNDIVDEIMHQLKGEVYLVGDDGKGKYVQKFDRWVNDEGIYKIIHIMYSNGLNKGIFLANLTHDEIAYKMNALKKQFARLIFKKYQEYGIKKEMRSLVVSTLVNQIHTGLSRCEGGKEADQLSVATTRLEHYQHQEQQKEGNSFTKILPFGKR